MTSYKSRELVVLTQYTAYEERGVALERCPNCYNDRMGKSPRRKGGPSMFHCKRCGYMTNVDLVDGMHRLLNHRAA